MNKRIYFKNLDALRFLCFLSVFFYHSFHSEFEYIRASGIYQHITRDVFGNGILGVNFFFVLSGFLITYLLIEEKEETGRINIGSFWLRRVLRIWPLYFAAVLFGFVIFPQIKLSFGEIPSESANIWYYVFFANNFDYISSGGPDSSVLGVLWSVAIEEQFYLVWPLLLALCPIRYYWVLFISVIAGSWTFRAMNDVPILHAHHTFSCIADMAIGAFGAWLIQCKGYREKVKLWSKPFIYSVYVLFILIYFFRDEVLYANYYVRIFERSFIGLVFLAIILEQNYSQHSFIKFGKLKLLTQFGKISYGLYCLHFIGILAILQITKMLSLNTELWQVLFIETPLALLITIGISKISHRYYEMPFLKLKERSSFRSQGDSGTERIGIG